MAASIERDGRWLVVRFPFDFELVAEIKRRFAAPDRKWDGERKVWLVSMRHEAALRSIIRRHFAIDGEEDGPPPPPPPTFSSNVYEDLLGGLPFDVMKKVYRTIQLSIHPDHGGDLRLSQRVNAAWGQIERRYSMRGV